METESRRPRRRRFGISIALVATSQVATGALMLLRDSAIARRIGVGEQSDAIFVSLALLSFFGVALRASLALTYVADSARADLRISEIPNRAQGLARSSILAGTVSGSTIFLIVLVFSSPLARMLHLDERALFVSSLIIAAGGALILSLSSVPLGLLLAENRHTAIGVASVLQVTPSILYLEISPSVSVLGISATCLSGICLEAVLLTFFARSSLRHVRAEGTGFPHRDHDLKHRVQVVAATSVFAMLPVVDIVFASSVGPGSASLITMASRLPLAIGGLLATSIALPLLPSLRFASGVNAEDQVRNGFRKALFLAAVSSIGLTAIVIPMTGSILRLLYSNEALIAIGSDELSNLQILYWISLVPYVVGTVAARAFHVRKRGGALLKLAGIAFFVNALADLLLVRACEISGIPIASTIVYFCTMVAGLTIVWRPYPLSRSA